jgi:hypothetical protein
MRHTAMLSLVAAAALGGGASGANLKRRQLQSDICAADISGPARGVPDGNVNVMDVRTPSPAPCTRAGRAQPLRGVSTLRRS